MFIVVILAFTVAFNFPAIWERKVIINVNGEMEVIPTSLR